MIPYKVDASLDHRPIANWLVFAGVILAFVIKTRVPAERIEPFILQGWSVWGLLLHSWLHTNPVHLVFNLLFLWPFGNAVCGKIGNKAYLGVFFGFNLFGGIIHAVFSDNPAVAPCAAIAAIIAMYLVFFPENTIGCFFLLPRPVLFDIPGGFIIFVWFVVDLVTTLWDVQAVAYFVHIFCFAGGLGLAVLMLKKKWIVMAKDEKSLLQMLKRQEEEPQEQKEQGEAGEKKQEQEQTTDSGTIEGHPQTPAGEKPQPERTAAGLTAEKPGQGPGDVLIRFSCLCGKRIKVPAEYAGRTGRCPACKKLIKIPFDSN